MNYDWIKYSDIEKEKYPNLLAELKESGYSICTISEWMGYERCEEDNRKIWDKLTGKTELTYLECYGLVRLFNVEFEYLFSHDLTVLNNKSQAYWRWFDYNYKCKLDLQRQKAIKEIYDVLVAEPHIFEFMKKVVTLTKQQREQVLHLLKGCESNETN